MTINERIKFFIKTINSNASALSSQIGVSGTSIQKAVTGQTQPSSKVLIPLKEHYPNLNMNWVIIGQGDMFLDKTGGTEERILEKDKLITVLEASVQDLRQIIDFQKKEIKEKDKEIKALKKG